MKNSSLCLHFPQCGGCDLLAEDYMQTLKNKQKKVMEIFSAYKKVEIPPFLPSRPEHHYRHKVQLPFGRGETGPVVGLLAKDRKKIISQKDCYIQHPHLTLLAGLTEAWARKNRFLPYDERRHKGQLRHLLLRRSSLTGEILLAISLLNLPSVNLEKNYSELFSIIQRELETAKDHKVSSGFANKSRLAGAFEILRNEKGNIVLEGRQRKIFGIDTMEEGIDEYRFSLSLDSFFQTNPYQIRPLYDLVKDHVKKGSHILDAYSGPATIGLYISDKALSVTCLELNQQAVKAGKEAIALAAKTNVKIFRADTGSFLVHKWKVPGQDSGIILDPPRDGLTQQGMNGLWKVKADYIIYVSCDPITLKRDADLLQRYYYLISLQGVDMFPFTNHIEAVAVFQRK